MAPAPLNDLTHLLAEVASRLSRPPGGESISASISSLAAALNPSAPASGTRALDAALSLIERVFSLQVNRARLNCLVRTIVSALSESVSCRVVRTDERNGGEMLCFGSSLSPGGCRELVRSCAALVDKLGDRDVDFSEHF
ncbi:hypothetical protein ACQ4PT_056099 [Festuca glaucescens]